MTHRVSRRRPIPMGARTPQPEPTQPERDARTIARLEERVLDWQAECTRLRADNEALREVLWPLTRQDAHMPHRMGEGMSTRGT